RATWSLGGQTNGTPGMLANVPGSIRVARIFGIDINVHFSWIVIFFVVVTNLSESIYPDQFPKWSREKTFVVSAVSATLFFVSVVAHELAHSLVARRFQPRTGIPARRLARAPRCHLGDHQGSFAGIAHRGARRSGLRRHSRQGRSGVRVRHRVAAERAAGNPLRLHWVLRLERGELVD